MFFGLLLYSYAPEKIDYTTNLVKGNPEIASINALAFGPDGILFIGDSQNAKVVAIDTGDKTPSEAQPVNVVNVDLKIAELLGSHPDQVNIQDMVVNPVSKVIYIAVHHENGTPALFRLSGEKLEWVPLDNVPYSQNEINRALSADSKDRRGNSFRRWTVSDLSFHNGKVLVTGLSNREFGSTFQAMNFPFNREVEDATLEIYHAAHGQYETQSPVKSFTTAHVGGQDYLIAGYTCTPLVLFPMSELKNGVHSKGRTIAELGNWNTPTDMIVMEKGEESYLLIANTNRSLMKIKFSDIERFEGSLTTPVKERSGTAGIDFIALPFVNVLQLDRLDEKYFVLLKREVNGELNLITESDRWL